jgi:hypothetical protein
MVGEGDLHNYIYIYIIDLWFYLILTKKIEKWF